MSTCRTEENSHGNNKENYTTNEINVVKNEDQTDIYDDKQNLYNSGKKIENSLSKIFNGENKKCDDGNSKNVITQQKNKHKNENTSSKYDIKNESNEIEIYEPTIDENREKLKQSMKKGTHEKILEKKLLDKIDKRILNKQ